MRLRHTPVAAVAVVALRAGRPTAGRVRLARVLAALVVASALFGVWEHVCANFDAGVLDRRYSETWESLSLATRWWLAVSKTVGPSPPLAPGALAQAAICALLATVRHPSLTARTG
jgi:hypothetical protein